MIPRFKMSLIQAIVGQVLFFERQEARTIQREFCIVIPWFLPPAGCGYPAKWCTLKCSETRKARQPCRKAVYVWLEPSYKQGRTVFRGRHEEEFSKKVKHEEDFCKKKLSIWAVGWRYADAPLSWTHPRNVISWSSTNTRNTSIGAAKKIHFQENQVIFTIFDKEAAGCQHNLVL